MIVEQFFKIMDKFSPYENNPNFAVAVSGGSDSLALVFLLNEYVKKYGGEIVALTVDHGLREESSSEAIEVGKIFSRHGIKHKILKWDGEKPVSGVEEKAREARYRLLFSYCKEHTILHLLVAHTKNDQAETFLMRLRRGSGLDGLSSIKSEVLTKDLRILRPLLSFTRDDLRDYLNEINEKWIDDPSNFHDCYERVRFRKLIPEISEYGIGVDCLCNAVNHLQRAKEAIDYLMVDAMAKTVLLRPEGLVLLDADKLLTYPEEIILRVLSRILVVVADEITPPRMEKLLNLKNALPSLTSGLTLNKCVIRKYKNKILFFKEFYALENAKDFENKGNWDRFCIECQGFKGRIGPLGESGYKQIKDFVRKSYPSAVLKGLPSLFVGDEVIFTPHLEYLGNKRLEILVKLDIKFSLT